jgi:hypothetical protein
METLTKPLIFISVRPVLLLSTESGLIMVIPSNLQRSMKNSEEVVSTMIQLSQPTILPSTGVINLELEASVVKSVLMKITKINTVSFGRDQPSSQFPNHHHFGERMVYLQKHPNKVLSEIAGSFHLLLLLLLFPQEFTTSLLTMSIHAMVPLKFSSTSEVRELALPLMTKSQFLISEVDTLLNSLQSTLSHLQPVLGG